MWDFKTILVWALKFLLVQKKKREPVQFAFYCALGKIYFLFFLYFAIHTRPLKIASPVKDEPLQPENFPINPEFKKDVECDDSIEITLEITLDNLSSSHIELALVLGKIRQVFKDNQKVTRVPNDFKLRLRETCRKFLRKRLESYCG